MNSLFGVCCKNFYVPWITGSWTRNYLCIFSLTYLSTVACAEDSNAVREEVWWEGRLLGKGSLRPPKAGNYSYRIALQRKKLRFPAVTNKAKYLFLHSISFLETEHKKEKEMFVNSSIWAIPWLDFGSPKLSPSSPPSPHHPSPSNKRNAWGVSVTLP